MTRARKNSCNDNRQGTKSLPCARGGAEFLRGGGVVSIELESTPQSALRLTAPLTQGSLLLIVLNH